MRSSAASIQKLNELVHDGVLQYALEIQGQSLPDWAFQTLQLRAVAPRSVLDNSPPPSPDVGKHNFAMTVDNKLLSGMRISVLAMCILYQKSSLFLEMTPRVFFYERRLVQSPRGTATLWHRLEKPHFINFLQKVAHRNAEQLYDCLGTLHYILHRSRLFHVFINAVRHFQLLQLDKVIDPREFLRFMTCWKPLTPCRQRFLIFTECMPPVEIIFREADVVPEKAQAMRHLLLKHNMFYAGRYMLDDPFILKTVYNTVHPLLSCAAASARSASMVRGGREYVARTSGGVYLVYLDQLIQQDLKRGSSFNRLDNMCKISFSVFLESGGQEYYQQVILSCAAYDEFLASPHRTILFFRHGISVHPRIAKALQLPEKFQNKIPRLRFGRHPGSRSDGMFLPNAMELSRAHGTDVTEFFSIYARRPRKQRKGPNRLRRRLQNCYTQNLLSSACLLDVVHLERASPVFFTLNRDQQILFIVTCWNIGSANAVRCLPGAAAYVQFMSPIVDALVDVHDGHNLLHHTSCQHRFWDRLRRIGCSMKWSPPVNALIDVTCHGLYSYLDLFERWIVENSSETLYYIVHIMCVCGVRFTPLPHLSNNLLVDILRHFTLPPAVARVVYHCLVMNQANEAAPVLQPQAQIPLLERSDAVRVPPADLGPLATREAKIDLPFLVSDELPEGQVRISRDTKRVVNVQELLGWSCLQQWSTQSFDLVIQGEEESIGKAVYEDGLALLWQGAVESKWFVRISNDQKDTTVEGYMVSQECPTTEETMEQIFALGFVTSLCVHRGMYLPIPIHRDLWTLITHPPQTNVPYERLEILQSYCLRTLAMSLEDFTDTFAVTDDVRLQYGNDPRDNMEFMYNECMPPLPLIQRFQCGWNVFIPIAVLNQPWNDTNTHMRLFNPPWSMETEFTVQRVKDAFRFNLPEDERFVEAITQFTPEELRALVEFVTGKPRLPQTAYGENHMSISWTRYASTHTLPRAQNCTHTLLLQKDIPSVYDALRPILRYPTVFGFI